MPRWRDLAVKSSAARSAAAQDKQSHVDVVSVAEQRQDDLRCESTSHQGAAVVAGDRDSKLATGSGLKSARRSAADEALLQAPRSVGSASSTTISDSPLFAAVRDSDVFRVQALLRDRADPNAESPLTGTSMLGLAASATGDGRKSNSLNVVALLLSYSADPDMSRLLGDSENDEEPVSLSVLMMCDIFTDKTVDCDEKRSILAGLDPGVLAQARKILRLPGPFAQGGSAPIEALTSPSHAVCLEVTSTHRVSLCTADSLRPLLELTPMRRQPSAILLLFHGLFQSGPMLEHIARRLSEALPHVLIWMPTAPTRITYGIGPAWYNFLDPEDTVDGLNECHAEVLALLSHQYQELGLGPERVILGGFSMGGAVAAWTALHLPCQVAGLLLLASEGLNDRADSRASVLPDATNGLPVLYCYGGLDRLCPVDSVQDGAKRLHSRGCSVQLSEHRQVGHTLSDDMLEDMIDWLCEQVPDV